MAECRGKEWTRCGFIGYAARVLTSRRLYASLLPPPSSSSRAPLLCYYSTIYTTTITRHHHRRTRRYARGCMCVPCHYLKHTYHCRYRYDCQCCVTLTILLQTGRLYTAYTIEQPPLLVQLSTYVYVYMDTICV